jgi:hypothetical protein
MELYGMAHSQTLDVTCFMPFTATDVVHVTDIVVLKIKCHNKAILNGVWSITYIRI